jgi:mannose-6-phosphate isomerase-like protein (cupin superfamily)
MHTHIKEEDVQLKSFDELELQMLMNDPSNDSISFTKMKLKGGDTSFTLNKGSNLYYYILDGEGAISFDKERIKVKKGDLIVIPKNTKYRDEGNMTILGIASPRFKSGDTVYLD